MAVAADGSVYVAGSTWFSDRSSSLLLRKYSPQGTVVWTRLYHEGDVRWLTVGNGVAVAPDGSVYVVGETAATSPVSDALLLKYSADGTLAWKRTFDGGGRDLATAVAADGELCLTGSTTSGSGGWDVLLQCYHATGELKWTRTFHGFREWGWNGGTSVATNGQLVYVVGQVDNGMGPDLFLATFNWRGGKIYLRTYDGGQIDTATGSGVAAPADDGGIYVSGSSHAPYESFRLLRKYGNNGRLVWSRSEASPGSGTIWGHGVARAPDGNVFQTGTSIWQSGGNRYGFMALRKYSPSGARLWSARYRGAGTGVAVGADGSVYVVGRAVGGGLLLLKYR
ncbi:MAG TPA: hypothetical protein VI078_09955 [bacterium]